MRQAGKRSGSGFSTHAVARTTRLGQWLLETYLKHRKKSRPEKIILDIDSTDDVTHGQQEFSFYHGYYREHMYHPLLLFDGETGDLCALLRPGNQGAAAHAVAVQLAATVEPLVEQVQADYDDSGEKQPSSPSSSIRPTVGTGSGAWWPRWK